MIEKNIKRKYLEKFWINQLIENYGYTHICLHKKIEMVEKYWIESQVKLIEEVYQTQQLTGTLIQP